MRILLLPLLILAGGTVEAADGGGVLQALQHASA
jgi:hypothetical protein